MTPDTASMRSVHARAGATRLTHRVVALVATVATGLTASLVGVPPAQASNDDLCSGYHSCARQGMGHDRYARNNDTMYWRMYSGHNCTNYAAYRMVRSGMANDRPWSGSGNADNWGRAMDHITDQRPRVGSIAWWRASDPGGGSAGHLAYVEKVVSPTEIIVSEDNWGGDFHWVRITTDGAGWPSGFIHFNDERIRVRERPAIEGSARVGQTLKVTRGRWRPDDVSLRYRWRAAGDPIKGATSRSYTVQRQDQGKKLTVRVRARRLGYPRKQITTAATEPVQPGELRSTSAPRISGTPTVDETLTADPGSWNVPPEHTRYQWFSAGTEVSGATAQTFSPRPADVGNRVSVRVTASRKGYDDRSVDAAATEPVSKASFTWTKSPGVSGPNRPDHTLTVDPGSVTPEAARTSVQWLRNGDPVQGATGMHHDLTGADLGDRFRVRVRHRRPGYRPARETTSSTRRIKSPARLRVRDRVNRYGVVRFRARVTAPYLDPVAGTVRVRHRGETIARGTLEDGVVRFRIRGIRDGRRRFVIHYRSTHVTTGARTVRWVSIP